jgi:hypothetical protein
MKGDGRDPRPMLAIFTVLVVAALWSAVSSIRVDHLLASAASLAPFALGAVAIALALAPQRFLATRRALTARATVAVIPADEFDPKPETVLRFAAELARADRSLRGWLDRRAQALRVQLTNDREGRLVYLLEVPERSRGLLRTALRGYEGAELREVTDVPAPDKQAPGKTVRLRTELTLARASVEPLARLDLDPDPLQPFAAAMASLRPKHGERVTVSVDLLPSAGTRRSRLQRRLKREARRLHGRGRTFMEVLNNERRSGPADPGELFERRLVGEVLNAKLRDSGPLFEAQILLCCEAAEKPQAKETMRNLLAAFEPFAGHNHLRPSGLGIGNVAFFGADNPLRRRGFDHRLSTGLHRPARRMILAAREVAGFLKPPNAHCVSENIVRSGTLLPAPPALPEFKEGDPDLIPLGRVGGERGKTLVGARTADTFFTYIAGRSRYGKTETAIAQFVHLVRCGHGGLFLDPHGDALRRIRPYLGEPKLARRVVEIDVGQGGGWSLPGWNLFELRGEDTAAVEARVEAVVDAFASTMQWSEQSTRAINLTTQAAAALAHAARALPPGLAPTIFQLPTLLSDERWREAVLPFLPKASQRFWLDRFPLLSGQHAVDRREEGIALPPLRLAIGAGQPLQLGVAGQLGRQAVDRERRAVELQEALLDRHPLAVEQQVGEDGVGDQRPASAAPSAGDGVGDLVAPGEWAELIAALSRRLEEADRGVVDRQGVGLKRSRRSFGADQPRLSVERPRLAGHTRPQLGDVPEASMGAGRADVAGEAGVAEPHEHSLRPALAAGWQVDGADLRRREDSVLGERGNDLDPHLGGGRFQACRSAHAWSVPPCTRSERGGFAAGSLGASGAGLLPADFRRFESAVRMRSSSVSRCSMTSSASVRATAPSLRSPEQSPGCPATSSTLIPSSANGLLSSPRSVTWAMKR